MPNLAKTGTVSKNVVTDAPGLFMGGAFAFIFNRKDQVLLLSERPDSRKYEWGLPGGTLEANERPLDCVHREVFEETGLAIEVKSPLCYLKWDRHESGRPILVAFYVAEPITEKVQLSGEHVAFRWAGLDEIINEGIDLPPGTEAVVAIFEMRRRS
jgi:8-oxo-dGTP pyrophosphatase MutT (NUDIX family)